MCVKSWGGNLQSWEVKASLQAQRSGRGAGEGGEVGGVCSQVVRDRKQC